MGNEGKEFPISISTGVFGLVHEREQVPRLGILLNTFTYLQDRFSRPVGSEFNAVNVNWLEELCTMLATGMAGEFVRMADEGSKFSIHAPNDVPYSDFSNASMKRAVAAIHRIQGLIPINHVVVHADLVEPSRRRLLAELVGPDLLVYENSDNRPKGYPVRYAREIGIMAQEGLRVVIDVGHVCHAGVEVVSDYSEIITYQQAIAAYHVSSVFGADGMHYPLSSEYGREVLQLLTKHQQNMNGAVRVLESPMTLSDNPREFLSKEIKLMLNPELGYVK